MMATPWITYEGPNENDDGWWWYCECTGYSGGGTREEAVLDGEEHGRWCDKGRARWEAYERAQEAAREY